MATRRKTNPDAQIVGMVPVNANGDILPGGAAWQMPAGQDEEDDLPSGREMLAMEDDPPETAVDRVASMLQNASGDASSKIVLYRQPSGGKKMAWLDDLTPDDFERGGLKMISEKWGAGEYEIRLYGNMPSGKYGLRSRTIVTLEAPRIVLTPNAGNSELAQVLAQMASQQGEMLRAITARPEPVDSMTQMTQMFGMLKLMREAMGSDQPKSGGITEMIEAIKQLKGVNNLINPPEPDESLMGMASKMLPMIQSAIQTRQEQVATQPVPMMLPPASIQNAQPPADPAQQENDEMPLNPEALAAIQLKGYLRALVVMAEQKAPIEEAATLVYEKLPDELIDLLELPVWFSMLLQIAPEAQPHEAYLTEVRNATLAMLNEPDEETGPGEGHPSGAPAVATGPGSV